MAAHRMEISSIAGWRLVYCTHVYYQSYSTVTVLYSTDGDYQREIQFHPACACARPRGQRGHSTLYNVHCSLHTLHCTLFTVHCALCTVHCALYTVHCTLCTVHCSLHTLHCTLFTVHCALYTLHCSLYTVHCSCSASPRQWRYPCHRPGALDLTVNALHGSGLYCSPCLSSFPFKH